MSYTQIQEEQTFHPNQILIQIKNIQEIGWKIKSWVFPGETHVLPSAMV